ncbi:MAG: hypothetical protein V8Q86_00840 [Blautia sp.]
MTAGFWSKRQSTLVDTSYLYRLPFASARQSNENSRYPYENKKMKPTVWAVNL